MRDETYAILNFEQDWDDPCEYVFITETGIMVTYNIITEELNEIDMTAL